MSEGGRLEFSRLAKPWGRRDLPEPFGFADEAIGEIWFERPEPLSDILAKYLFTGEKLSVQVHPTPSNSPTGSGKDECWLITEAREDAILAIGFREDYDTATIRAAALDGSISHMLEWRAARTNDFLYVPAGTVHAIGPGLTLVEVQQNTDITHRLFDYGRDRELNLDEALASITTGPHPDHLRLRVSPERLMVLVDGPYFRLYHLAGDPGRDAALDLQTAVQVIPLAGFCQIGATRIEPGQAGWASTIDGVDFSASERCLVIAGPRL